MQLLKTRRVFSFLSILISFVMISSVWSTVEIPLDEEPRPNPLQNYSSSDLYFQLTDDIAFIKYTRTNSDDTKATVDFNMKADTTFITNALLTMQACIEYDPDSLEFLTAYMDLDSLWDGEFTFIEDNTGDLFKVYLDFTGGSITAPTVFTTYAQVEFRPLCQPELNTVGLDVRQGDFYSFVTDSEGDKYVPIENCIDDGTVSTPDYISEFFIIDSTISGNVGDDIWLVVNGTINSLSYVVEFWVSYDPDMLEFIEYDLLSNWDHDLVNIKGDTAVRVAFYDMQINHPEEFDEDFFKLKFRLKCDIVDTTTTLSFLDTSFAYLKYEMSCAILDNGEDFTDTGVIALNTSSAVKLAYTGNPLSKSNDGDSLDFEIQTKGTFETGMANSSDTGIAVNIQYPSNYTFSSENGSIDMGWQTNEGYYLSLEQNWNVAYDSTWQSSDTFITRHHVYFDWDNSSYTPDWDDQYIRTSPHVVGDYASSQNKTQLPNVLGCFTHDSANTKLTITETDSIPVMMGQIAGGIGYGNEGCPKQNIYVKNNFPLDSFSFNVSCNSNFTIIGVTTYGTGVSYSSISNRNKKFYTTGSFAGFSASQDSIKVAMIQYSCAELCGDGCGVGVSIFNRIMLDSANAEEQYVDYYNGSVSGNCQYWSTCSIGVEKQVEEETGIENNGLPTVFALHQNYPNPFNPITTISLDLPKSSEWTITIYNIKGQIVKSFDGNSPAGTISVEWDASNHASGIYLYRANADAFVETRKMILIK